ncbi:hypothetical protein [Halorubrum trueperi]|uniref:DUF7981 domain-containing protein n=1 Tax=Halorubrum trueperi TaxID=2004704 RepID=A0ABD5UEZ1_9EURY
MADRDAADRNAADRDVTDRDAAGGSTNLTGSGRTRAKSATLWGLVGGFAFLVLAQGYLLVGGTGALPIPYAGVFAIAGAIAATSGGIAYATEHRLRAKRRT